MSIEYQNLPLDGLNFDDYFNALISPVQVEKKPEAIMMELNKFKDNKSSEIKNPLKLEYSNLQPQLPNLLNNNLIPKVNKKVPNKNVSKVNKRKILAETSRDVTIKQETKQQTPQIENEEQLVQEQQLHEQQITETESEGISNSSSPTKKSKKNPKNTPKKKKEAPKRKRVNYCFEIHRSGCSLNKESKLYCKVFLKGKLQSEVDLIKGARGKWAYTFYDQRKKKKERRYWPSQSSGPVIEDPCYCEKCIPNLNNKNLIFKNNNLKKQIKNEETEFSSPSTEEATLIEYDQINSEDNQFGLNQQDNYVENQIVENQENQYSENNQENHYFQNQYENQDNYVENQLEQNQENQYVEYQNVNYGEQTHIVYYMPPNYQSNNSERQEFNNQYSIRTSNDYQNMVLKSSNEFQDRSHYLKSSNDFVNQQRNWEVQQNNSTVINDYQNENFFVENNFL